MSYEPASGYEPAIAVNPTRQGPKRFEEGVVTDADVPRNFMVGAYGDPGAGVTLRKEPGETQQERLHVGSAAWIESPAYLGEFQQGAFTDHPRYERVAGSEARLYRPNPTTVG